jgi:hypothetical protein
LACVEWAWPRNVEVTAMSGDAACLGPCAVSRDQWWRLLWFGVSCVVCHGTWGQSRWLAVVGWGSV